jgi:hypothetical protein
LAVRKKQEAAAAEVSSLGMDDGERKAGGHGGVDGIAARARSISTASPRG